jgi:glutamate/tyrosine decarboxylase-like PLP-dependent enzyme
MPSGSGGVLTSGGSAANFTAMAAARHRLTADDASLIPQLTVYLSDQAHSSVVRAAWMAGIPRDRVRLVPTDDAFRLRADALRDAIAADRDAGLRPLMVVANGASTNTGAVDPLDALADLCAHQGLWLHVDAAYGGFATLTPEGRRLLAGIGRADSVTLDPHKWLYVPFECGCLLVRDPSCLLDAFRILPDYMRDKDGYAGAVDFADYGEQLTRSARALKVWLVVRYYGLAMLRAAIAAGMERALHAERLVRASPELELLAPTEIGVCCFRAHPPGQEDPDALDALNARINEAVNAGHRYFISSTRLRGRFALRICPIGHRTTAAEVEGLLADVVRLSRASVAAGAREASIGPRDG